MNPVLETLFKHKSIIKYKDQPLEDEKLHYIINTDIHINIIPIFGFKYNPN